MGFIDRLKSLAWGQKETPKEPEQSEPRGPSMYYWMNSFPASGWFGQKTIRSFTPTQPLFINYNELRRQAEKVHLESTHAQSIVSRIADLTISTGVRLEATPAWDVIDPEKMRPEEDRQKWVRNHETRFALWAESKEASTDGRRTFYQLQHIAMVQKIVCGEYFFIVRYLDDPERMSPVSLQMIRPEQVRNPTNRADFDRAQKRGHTIREGIEFDYSNKPIAYYVHAGLNYERIEARSPKSKRIFMIHGFDQRQVGQIRGISRLSGILHDLAKMTDYTVAELDSALANAIIAMSVTPSGSAPTTGNAFGGIKKVADLQQPDPGVQRSIKQGRVQEGGIVVQTLGAGEKLESYDTKRPNVNFGDFMSQTMKYASGAIGYGVEVIEQSFGQNYSASRATLKLTWNSVEIDRRKEVDDFMNLVHEAWFREEVAANNIRAEGFGRSALMTQAWMKTDWIGLSAPDIDPQKTAQARKENIALGLTTHEREAAAHNGSEFDENVGRLEVENQKLRKANGGAMPEATPPAMPIEDDEEPASDDSETGDNADEDAA